MSVDFKNMSHRQKQEFVVANSPFFGKTYIQMKEADPEKAEKWLDTVIKKSDASKKSFLHNPIGVGQETFDKVLELPTDLMSKSLGIPKELIPILLIGGALLIIVMVIK